MAAEAQRPGALMTWWLAARPKTLVAALAPILVATALAWREDAQHLPAALLALLGAFLIQIGTNLTNDLYDFKRGADTAERLGPMRVTQAGLVTQRQIAVAIALTFGAAFACGLYLTWRAGWPLLALGLVSILSGVAYTAGPFPLAYRGLGDLFVFIFFGVVATVGAYYVQTLRLDLAPLVASFGVGTTATALIVVNNLRDIDGDARVNKRTLAVRLGRPLTIAWFRLLLLATFLTPLGLYLLGFGPTVFLADLAAIAAIPLARDIARLHGAEMNGLLARTARLQLIFGVLLTVGVVLA
jgi:1,4-dihydroxy-2-naphthoate octaprenyltransferase